MSRHALKQVDVFTTTPLAGNPAAVVFDAEALAPATMQAVAREMNLSETVFVLPPTTAGADYRARIFTPRSELPFAGHPTIAAASAVLADGRLLGGRRPALLRQECGIGIVPVAVEERPGAPFFLMTQAPPVSEPVALDAAACARLLGCRAADVMDLPAEIVSTGIRWLIVPLRGLVAVRGLVPDLAAIEAVCRTTRSGGLTVFALEAERPEHAVRVRSFAPGEGVPEDPVCGSGNGSVAAYVAAHGLLGTASFRYVAEQGGEIGRPGLVTVQAARDGEGRWTIRVGGQAVTVLEGTLTL